MPKLEVIVESVADARAADAGGAHTLEVIADLSRGGLTPPYDVVAAIQDVAQAETHVMVRRHDHSFVYSEQDMEHMLKRAEAFNRLGVTGIVFGALHPDNTLHFDQLHQIRQAAPNVQVTFHRAIDQTPAPEGAVLALISSVDRILSSGGAESAWHGRDMLKDWAAHPKPDYQLVVGGGVKHSNLPDLVQHIGDVLYHVGSAAREHGVVNADKVRALVKLLEE